MKVRVEYSCEICGSRSEDRASIEECEKRGRSPEPPRWLLFEEPESDFYGRIVFLTAHVEPRGHSWSVAMWAARDKGLGDNLGQGMCGTGGVPFMPKSAPIVGTPRWNRMMAFVKTRPTIRQAALVWDAGNIRPLAEFLRRAKRRAAR